MTSLARRNGCTVVRVWGQLRARRPTFGMLSYQAWRAARLVVDTGIHAQGWTREQAQQYLRENIDEFIAKGGGGPYPDMER